jgi:hypothetical protein
MATDPEVRVRFSALPDFLYGQLLLKYLRLYVILIRMTAKTAQAE